MVKTDSDMDNSLKERSIAPSPLHPYVLDNIVTFKKAAVVEQLNTLFESFSFRKYTEFRLKFQLKNAFPRAKMLQIPVF
jgi:hypothetical protein